MCERRLEGWFCHYLMKRGRKEDCDVRCGEDGTVFVRRFGIGAACANFLFVHRRSLDAEVVVRNNR